MFSLTKELNNYMLKFGFSALIKSYIYEMKYSVRPIIILTAILIFNFKDSNAWGSKGHKIVAQIAKSFLEKPVIDSVQYYLGSMSFDEASVWMDEIKSDHEFDYLKPLHYANVEKDKTYVATNKPNIINELESVLNVLKTPGARDKDKVNMALKELFHLVGDIHQPLHCGYFDDKGGNTVQVRFMEKGSNLHKVWDSEIIESKSIATVDCLKLYKNLTKADISEIQKINILSWMNDSRKLLANAYDFQDNKLGQDYINKNAPIIEKQLLIAGVRLANILNIYFKKKK